MQAEVIGLMGLPSTVTTARAKVAVSITPTISSP
jgi:hypothetical protein